MSRILPILTHSQPFGNAGTNSTSAFLWKFLKHSHLKKSVFEKKFHVEHYKTAHTLPGKPQASSPQGPAHHANIFTQQASVLCQSQFQESSLRAPNRILRRHAKETKISAIPG